MEGLVATLLIVPLKLLFELSSPNAAKFFEVLFCLSFGQVILTLAYLQLFAKDYIFTFYNSENSISLA